MNAKLLKKLLVIKNMPLATTLVGWIKGCSQQHIVLITKNRWSYSIL